MIIELCILNNFAVFVKISKYYDNNHYFVRFFYYLGKYFNGYCSEHNLEKFLTNAEDGDIESLYD